MTRICADHRLISRADACLEGELWWLAERSRLIGMDHLRYAGYLPAEYRSLSLPAPTSTWWPWRGRRVHIARAEVPEARVRVLMIHGAGGHAGLLWPFAAVAAHEGAEAMAVDLPLYGDTVEPRPAAVRYRDWVDLLTEFVRAETESDDRPLVLFGASIGGMLAYEAAARTRAVAHVVATCLLDPADPDAGELPPAGRRPAGLHPPCSAPSSRSWAGSGFRSAGWWT